MAGCAADGDVTTRTCTEMNGITHDKNRFEPERAPAGRAEKSAGRARRAAAPWSRTRAGETGAQSQKVATWRERNAIAYKSMERKRSDWLDESAGVYGNDDVVHH